MTLRARRVFAPDGLRFAADWTMSRHLARFAVIVAAVLAAVPAHAQDTPSCRPRTVNVERVKSDTTTVALCMDASETAVRLQVRRTTIAAALSALSAVYKISYRASVTLEETRDGIYAGSLDYVISRVLDGYDYVIKHEGRDLDVLVLGQKGGQAVAAPAVAEAGRAPARAAAPVSRIR